MNEVDRKPAYLNLDASGELKSRVEKALSGQAECFGCPRRCGINRLKDERGFCRTGRLALVSSHTPHFGEESPLVGSSGSGTVFFANCNLGCVFCQNYEISHLGAGEEVSADQLAAMMVSLQEMGCHNINLVTPSHVVPQILEALLIAIKNGLRIPLVYNSSGYDAVESLAILDGIIDIYMPDLKFWASDSSRQLAAAPDYPERSREALKEMYRQVGDLLIDDNGIAFRGLLVRHLVMPGGLDETRQILEFLALEISPETYVNVMDQYRPCGRAREFPPLDRSLAAKEYAEAMEIAKGVGLTRLDEKNWSRILQRLGIF